jgi:hypothetical protein
VKIFFLWPGSCKGLLSFLFLFNFRVAHSYLILAVLYVRIHSFMRGTVTLSTVFPAIKGYRIATDTIVRFFATSQLRSLQTCLRVTVCQLLSLLTHAASTSCPVASTSALSSRSSLPKTSLYNNGRQYVTGSRSKFLEAFLSRGTHGGRREGDS